MKMMNNKYIPPFRIGKKQKRTILDSLGHELVIFNSGLEEYAQEYCDFLNTYQNHNNSMSTYINCNRVEVIDENGRSYVNWKNDNYVRSQLQDNNKTLKIFINNNNLNK